MAADRQRRRSLFDCVDSRCQCNRRRSYVSMCQLECPVECACFVDGHFGTYWIDCSGRSLLRISSLTFPPRLNVILDFSDNRLRWIDASTFLPIPSATELYLQNNSLNEVAADAFDDLPGLEILDSRFNSLEDLPAAIFAGLRKLTDLNLAGNRFVRLQSVVPTEWTTEHWTSPPRLMLADNPWSCDCDDVRIFRDWLHRFLDWVVDGKKLTRASSEDPANEFLILTYNFTECSAEWFPEAMSRAIPILASVISVMGFLAVIAILIYVYRRELEVILYHRTRVRFFKEKDTNGVDRVYDAFVAYSSEDLDFVALGLVPGLEKIENPYKLCVHERDFLHGIPIVDSIQAAVEYSLRTLVVLSQNFVDSRWCHFEFKTAHHRMISDPNHRLIVILLEEVPSGIDYEMKVYLRTNMYLKWGDRLFWQKLYHAMPDKRRIETGTDMELTTIQSQNSGTTPV